MQFWEVWNSNEESLRIPPIKSTLLLDYLATCLGMYLQEKLNMDWCYAANMKNPINGNVIAEITLRYKDSDIFVQPKMLLGATFKNTIDIINNEIKRLENEISKYQPDFNESKFEEFVANAKVNGSGADVVSIWDYVLNLKEWNFISLYEDDIQKSRPFIGVIHDKPWFFMFTTKEKALAYAKLDPKFLGANGESLVITQNVEQALEMVFKSESRGVFGLMVNENDSDTNSNFNVSIEVLRRIIQIINDNK